MSDKTFLFRVQHDRTDDTWRVDEVSTDGWITLYPKPKVSSTGTISDTVATHKAEAIGKTIGKILTAEQIYDREHSS